MKRGLPESLTSYDFAKTLAVGLMIVDHLGYYFFPEETWLRVIGRLCVPIWFFLIGYARSRDLSPRLWAGALILVAANIITGMSIIPLNILATIIAARLVIDPVMTRVLARRELYWPMMVIFLLLVPPTILLSEYGSHGLVLAVCGYLCRHRDKLENPRRTVEHYFVFAALSYFAVQMITFAFTMPQGAVFGAGLALVFTALYFFRPLTFPHITQNWPAPLVRLLQFGGRRTLEIYVAHLIAFKVLALFTDPGRFALFDWKLFSISGT